MRRKQRAKEICKIRCSYSDKCPDTCEDINDAYPIADYVEAEINEAYIKGRNAYKPIEDALIKKAKREVAERIKDNIRSCRAGDGDNRNWEQCACDIETECDKIIKEQEDL